jgi:glycosyltransferase involved in cell wall biosynthesis
MNYSIKPKLVTNGIHFDMFYNKPSNQLNTVGYGGTMVGHNFSGQEIKRGLLVQKVAETTNLRFFPNATYNHLAMAGYYKQVDSIIMSSTEEAGGLPMMEAAAAGRLTIGTPVGYYAEDAIESGGVIVSIDPNDFIRETREAIQRYQQDNQLYRSTCAKIQEYAIEKFNWPDRIEPWLNLFT